MCVCVCVCVCVRAWKTEVLNFTELVVPGVL